MSPKQPQSGLIERPPIVVVMGHIDHGKSTLLDYIRKTNVVDKEAGGITQKVGAYEVEIDHKVEGKSTKKRITFIDTPGHEAFQGIRQRGARTADVAILVVSAEDGVKPQTLQALEVIKKESVPYVVAINKIDRPNADIERTKQTLAEHEVYVEGYGGTTPVVAISAKTGENVEELLDMIVLLADLEELKADTAAPCTGFVLESERDKRKGNAATLIVMSGTLSSGEVIVAGLSYSPVRVFEDFNGKNIKQASFSSPVRVIGWDTLPPVGSTYITFKSKKEAEAFITEQKREIGMPKNIISQPGNGRPYIPVILRAGDAGRLDGAIHELGKLTHDAIDLKIVSSGVGEITETDIKTALSTKDAVVLGFGTNIDTPARLLAENGGIRVELQDIIYKLGDTLKALLIERAPKQKVEQATGSIKILKVFSVSRDKQVIGGRVLTGTIKSGNEFKILRRDNDVGRGRIRELQVQKERASEVEEGRECGMMAEAKVEIAPGDILETFAIVEM